MAAVAYSGDLGFPMRNYSSWGFGNPALPIKDVSAETGHVMSSRSPVSRRLHRFRTRSPEFPAFHFVSTSLAIREMGWSAGGNETRDTGLSNPGLPMGNRRWLGRGRCGLGGLRVSIVPSHQV